MKLSLQIENKENQEILNFEDLTEKQIVEVFNKIDWVAEIEKATEHKKYSPTLSLEEESEDKLIWFSAVGDKDKYVFYSECGFPGEVPSWFGLSKKIGIISLYTEYFNDTDVVKAIKYFMNNESEKLKKLY